VDGIGKGNGAGIQVSTFEGQPEKLNHREHRVSQRKDTEVKVQRILCGFASVYPVSSVVKPFGLTLKL
jgi:hypothetical protein